MNLERTRRFDAPPDRVWATLHDPDVLHRALPGCTGCVQDDEHRLTLTLTNAETSVGGTYRAEVARIDASFPTEYVLSVTATGDAGTLRARTTVELRPGDGETTDLVHRTEAQVDGRLQAIGQRLLVALVDRAAETFFAGIDAELALDRAAPDALDRADAPAAPRDGAAARSEAPTETPTPRSPDPRAPDLRTVLLVAAVAALVGILVGRWWQRRH